MSIYAVTREAGPAWTDGTGAFEQTGVAEHGAFMGNLADEGVVLFAGPLSGSETGRIHVLLIADAASEADVRRRLAEDPWEVGQKVVTTSVEPWNLLVGAATLSAASSTRSIFSRPGEPQGVVFGRTVIEPGLTTAMSVSPSSS